jgi:arginyl-tRNA synthetase
MSLISEAEVYISNILDNLGYQLDNVRLEVSSKREFGQYQFNGAMQLAKKYGENPRDIANKIVGAIDEYFTNINIQGPGFINLTFRNDVLINYLNKGIDDFGIFVDKNNTSKTIVLDYGGANIAKELHVGHLRCNIGEAARRLITVFGDKAISDVHWGDWGTPIGLVIREIQEVNPDLPYFDSNYSGPYPTESPVTNEDLGIYYPRASKRSKVDEVYAAEARVFTENFQKGVPGIRALWEHIVRVSREDCNKIYDYLNCKFDLSYGESDADKYVNDVLTYLKSKNVVEDSDGALILPVKEDTDKKEMPPLILVKSDGGILYDTTELATVYQRMKDFNPDGMWYFVDERQSLHFEQTFRACKKSGLVKEDFDFRFNGFGTINGSDGKPFKTRDGGIMSLKGLIKLVYDTIEPKIKDNITGSERVDVANKLTVATLKYSDLLPNRETDYIFDVDKFTSFEGKTGIYIVYTTTRIKSLLNKLDVSNDSIKVIPNDDVLNILVKITELPRTLTSCYREVNLSYICEFLYELCSLYNKFYTNNNIQNETNDDIKTSYIGVSRLVYNILHNLLNILAIDEVEKM